MNLMTVLFTPDLPEVRACRVQVRPRVVLSVQEVLDVCAELERPSAARLNAIPILIIDRLCPRTPSTWNGNTRFWKAAG